MNATTATAAATPLQLWGAGLFGLLIGWYVYYINRYRKGDVQLNDRLRHAAHGRQWIAALSASQVRQGHDERRQEVSGLRHLYWCFGVRA